MANMLGTNDNEISGTTVTNLVNTSGNTSSINSHGDARTNIRTQHAYESSQSQELPIVEPRNCCSRMKVSFSKSWESLACIYTDSMDILNILSNSPEYKPFKKSLRILFIIRIISLFVVIGLEAGVSYPVNWMFSALSEKNSKDFYNKIYIFSTIALVAIPFLCFDFYISNLLYLKFRQAVTKVLLKMYHSNNIYYHLNRKQDLDNPGQRLVRDVDEWTWGVITFTVILIKEVLRLFAWTFVLYTIGASMIIYVLVIGTIMCILGISFFASKLTRYSYLITRDDANLIASLVKTRDNSETIAFYNAHNFEEKWSYHRLLILLKDSKIKYQWLTGLDALEKFVKYSGILIPLVILGPFILKGEMRFGVITQSVMCFRELLAAITLIVNQMNKLANIQASGKRVAQVIISCDDIAKSIKHPPAILLVSPRITDKTNAQKVLQQIDLTGEAFSGVTYKKLHISKEKFKQISKSSSEFDEKHSEEEKESQSGLIIAEKDDNKKECIMDINGLNIILPDSNILLLHNLNWKLYENDNILIAGPSGSGKSSLMRVIAGLWRNGSGIIKKIKRSNIMFLPQKPYLPQLPTHQNSLKYQLLFPSFTNTHLLNETYLSSNVDLTQNVSDYSFSRSFSINDESGSGSGSSGSSGSSAGISSSNDSLERERVNSWLNDEKVVEILKEVNLDYVLKYTPNSDVSGNNKKNPDWSKLLSLGEQQRLAFARVIVRKPKLVFLDESTSALDVMNEKRMYDLLNKYDITYVSIGHRSTLVPFHNSVLHINGDSSWQFMNKQQYKHIITKYH